MSDHPSPHRQSKLNTIILSLLTGLIVLFAALLGYLGKEIRDDIKTGTADNKANALLLVKIGDKTDALVDRVKDIEKRLEDMVTQSEFRRELSVRDMEISELKKSIDSLRRGAASQRPGD